MVTGVATSQFEVRTQYTQRYNHANIAWTEQAIIIGVITYRSPPIPSKKNNRIGTLFGILIKKK